MMDFVDFIKNPAFFVDFTKNPAFFVDVTKNQAFFVDFNFQTSVPINHLANLLYSGLQPGIHNTIIPTVNDRGICGVQRPLDQA